MDTMDKKNMKLTEALNDIDFIRKNVDAIESEIKKGLEHDICDGGYVGEKARKAKNTLDDIMTGQREATN